VHPLLGDVDGLVLIEPDDGPKDPGLSHDSVTPREDGERRSGLWPLASGLSL